MSNAYGLNFGTSYTPGDKVILIDNVYKQYYNEGILLVEDFAGLPVVYCNLGIYKNIKSAYVPATSRQFKLITPVSVFNYEPVTEGLP